MNKRIAVLVSGGGTNLQALIDAQKRGEIKGGEIVSVVSSNPNAYALERARRENIDTYVIPKDTFKTNEEISVYLRDLLKEQEIDLIVLAGFMTILTEEFTKEFPNQIINVHPALIPSFCGEGYYGLHVHEKALDYGVKLSGATIHFVNEECDGGPIILQKSVEVLNDDTPESLQKRIMEECEWELLPKAVSLFCEDKLDVKGRRVKIL